MRDLRLLLALLLFSAAAPGQAKWSLIDPVSPRKAPALAFDPVLGKVLLFGGYPGGLGVLQDQWTWDGASWTEMHPPLVPPARGFAGAAWDLGRQRLVLFGGAGSTANFNDTWEWDGATWSMVMAGGTPASPQTRGNPLLAYDAGRNRTVLFENDRTYEWDGITWTLRTTATVPPNRFGAAMAWHAPSGRVVLFAGQGAPGVMADTWTWNGIDWRWETPAQSPPARSWAGMTFDWSRGKVVMSSGRSQVGTVTTPHNDAWEWDGTNWQALPTMQPLPPRELVTMAYDIARARVVQFGGGLTPFDMLGDLWEHDGSTWSMVHAGAVLPAGGVAGAAYDLVRARTVVHVGSGSTWEHDGTRWQLGVQGAGPQPRTGFAMTYDLARNRTLLFGGSAPGLPSPTFNDTWEWDGTFWTQRQPALRPPIRNQAAMAYDDVRGLVVMFGGATRSDTWEWDGNNWVQVPTASAPPPGWWSMTFDQRRRRMVLFGGLTNGETWEYDGSAWLLRSTSAQPASRSLYGLAYDPLRDRTVMAAGTLSGGMITDEVWEWDGATWQQQTVPRPQGRAGPAMVYDVARSQLLLWGGTFNTSTLRETWRCATDRPASFSSFGAGCAGSVGVPVLALAGGRLPWLGDVCGLELHNTAAGAAAALAFGFDTANWGGHPLPLSLPGMPGCSAYVSPVAFTDLRASGNMRWDFSIPFAPILQGLQLHGQGLILDSAVPNALRAAVSNAATATFGVR